MYSNEFEAHFDEYLDSIKYDRASEWLFSLLREAYAAGWQAAGGTAPAPFRLFELIEPDLPQSSSQSR